MVWRLFGSSNGGKLDLLISLEKLPYYQNSSRSAQTIGIRRVKHCHRTMAPRSPRWQKTKPSPAPRGRGFIQGPKLALEFSSAGLPPSKGKDSSTGAILSTFRALARWQPALRTLRQARRRPSSSSHSPRLKMWKSLALRLLKWIQAGPQT